MLEVTYHVQFSKQRWTTDSNVGTHTTVSFPGAITNAYVQQLCLQGAETKLFQALKTTLWYSSDILHEILPYPPTVFLTAIYLL